MKIEDIKPWLGGAEPRALAVMLAGTCSFLCLYTTQPLLPMLGETFQVGKAAVSMTVTVATMGVALSAPFVGWLADSVGRKKVIVTAVLMLAVATILTATAATLNQLIFWRFVQGIITPGIFAITVTYINEEWPAESTGKVMAAYISGTVIGGFMGRVLAGFTVEPLGWRWVFIELAVILLIFAAVISRWLPRERCFVRKSGRASSLISLRKHLTNRQLLTTCGVGFSILFSLVAMFTYLTFYLTAEPFSLNAAHIGSLFFVYLIGAVINPISGRWVTKYGHRTALALGIGVTIFGVLLTLGSSLAIIVTGLAICATGVFISQTTANSYIGVATSEQRAMAVGLYVTCYYLGGSAGATLPAFCWQLGGWTACVLLVATVQLITLSITILSWPKKISAPDLFY